MHYVREIQTTMEIFIALIINLLTLEKHIICIYVALLKKKSDLNMYST